MPLSLSAAAAHCLCDENGAGIAARIEMQVGYTAYDDAETTYYAKVGAFGAGCCLCFYNDVLHNPPPEPVPLRRCAVDHQTLHVQTKQE